MLKVVRALELPSKKSKSTLQCFSENATNPAMTIGRRSLPLRNDFWRAAVLVASMLLAGVLHDGAQAYLRGHEGIVRGECHRHVYDGPESQPEAQRTQAQKRGTYKSTNTCAPVALTGN